MSIKTVTMILTEPDQVAAQLAAATGFARVNDAHLHLLGLAIGMDQTVMAQTALDVVPVSTGMEEGIAKVKELVARVQEGLKNEDVRWNIDATTVTSANCASEIARHTRFSDLVIHQRAPQGQSDPYARILAEAVLFDADSPLLLLPDTAAVTAPPENILISWDESAAALRAVRQALPLMSRGAQVHVVMIEPPRDAPDRSDPGGALAQYLSRQGIRCEVSVCNRTDERISQTLIRRARELGCDMVVMGAYGHSRLREAIFGGTTRDVLESAPIPVFMAH